VSRVFAVMKNVQSLIPHLSQHRSEIFREKLSDYVAALLERNAARLSKYEKTPASRELEAE